MDCILGIVKKVIAIKVIGYVMLAVWSIRDTGAVRRGWTAARQALEWCPSSVARCSG